MESVTQKDAVRIWASDLQTWMSSVFQKIGVPPADAEIVTHVLVDADLTGRSTHGVSRLPLYVDRLESKLICATPRLRFESTGQPSMLRLDGGNGLGPLVAWRANEKAIELARDYGSSIIAVHHSNHCGAMSAYCSEAARQGMIVIALTNSPPCIPPWGGREAFFGTNPIAFGFPRGGDSPPLVIDMATSVVARGNIIQALRLGRPIPLGWAIDKHGNPTTDAQAALEGALLPMAGAKGYALALAVEVLTGILSGAGIGPEVKNPYTDHSGPSNVGHFFMVFNPGNLLPLSEFGARMNFMEAAIRDVPPAEGAHVAVPGDRSEALRVQYLSEGVPIDKALLTQLNELGLRYGVPGLR
jgi:LDH2 family malate/lactate/ureidoglycolate dehydrogenase